jgi:hypothetical protein
LLNVLQMTVEYFLFSQKHDIVLLFFVWKLQGLGNVDSVLLLEKGLIWRLRSFLILRARFSDWCSIYLFLFHRYFQCGSLPKVMSLSCYWLGLLQKRLRLLLDGSRRLHQTLYIFFLVLNQSIVEQIVIVLGRLQTNTHSELFLSGIRKQISLVIFYQVIVFRWSTFKFCRCLFFFWLLLRLFFRQWFLTL